ncbi:MAG: aminodeoxychorismate lyase [Myxococcales bacterium]|nr:MAG: aminodeoxychorismate lyase [Myxococcales bacterium]
MGIVIVNGVSGASCSPRDRGLQFGDGLFETMLGVGGGVVELGRHWRRLQDGCRRLGIHCPVTQEEVLTALRAAELPRAVVKLIVTRGDSGRGYRCPPALVAHWVLFIDQAPEYPQAAREGGVAVTVCRTRVPIEDEAIAGIKHLNRLPQVMARREWNDEYHDGLLMDPDGRVVEGCANNLFVVTGGVLKTPDLSRSGVHGVMRERVLEHAKANGIPTRVCVLDRDDLSKAEEVFLTNAIYGITPVGSIESHRYSANTLTARLVASLCRGTHC